MYITNSCSGEQAITTIVEGACQGKSEEWQKISSQGCIHLTVCRPGQDLTSSKYSIMC